MWETFPWMQHTVHAVFLSLRLEHSFSSRFCPFSLLSSPTSLIQVLFFKLLLFLLGEGLVKSLWYALIIL